MIAAAEELRAERLEQLAVEVADAHRTIQQYLADEVGTPRRARLTWKHFYFSMGNNASLDDLRQLIAVLAKARQRHVGSGAPAPESLEGLPLGQQAS